MWNVIGHNKQKKYFEQIVRAGHLSHAYLFSGPEMIGKKKFALDLYQLINDRLASDSDPDFKFITPRLAEDETKIYIEDIRDLINNLSFKPYRGPYKFVVINDADRMVDEASNAILKTLEEPTGESILILITSKPQLLLPTIRSRCEEVRFLPEVSGKISDQVRRSGEDLEKVRKQGIFEKMQYAKKIYESGNYGELISSWLKLVSCDEKFKDTKLIRSLLDLHLIISQPQYNHRLALENFLVNL